MRYDVVSGGSTITQQLARATMLAGLIQSPAAYNPLVAWDAAKARQAVVLERMIAAGYIDRAQAKLAAGNLPLPLPAPPVWPVGFAPCP